MCTKVTTEEKPALKTWEVNTGSGFGGMVLIKACKVEFRGAQVIFYVGDSVVAWFGSPAYVKRYDPETAT